ncbi:MAG: hypothetical protein ACRCZK_03660 [Oscillospiraceae bacterium]
MARNSRVSPNDWGANLMAQNFTTVIEHEKVTIIPGLGLEVRGRKTLWLLAVVYVPLTVIIMLLFRNNVGVLLTLFFIEIISLFFMVDYLQKNTRKKTDHISTGKKMYYTYKSYRKVVDSNGDVYYLRPTKQQHTLNIKRIR